MVRAVRPGGRIVLADDDHGVLRLWPEPPGWMSLWDAYMRAYDRIGNDPLVGRRLVQLLHEAGAQPVRNTWVFFGGCAGMETFPILAANMAGVVRTARDTIVSQSLFDARCLRPRHGGIPQVVATPRRRALVFGGVGGRAAGAAEGSPQGARGTEFRNSCLCEEADDRPRHAPCTFRTLQCPLAVVETLVDPASREFYVDSMAS